MQSLEWNFSDLPLSYLLQYTKFSLQLTYLKGCEKRLRCLTYYVLSSKAEAAGGEEP